MAILSTPLTQGGIIMKKLTTYLTAVLMAVMALPVSSARAADVMDKTAQSPQFETLSRALRAAGLDATFSGHRQFTLFAPTDTAFAKLPPGTLEELMKPSRKATLASILRYHVVPRRLSARALMRLHSGTNMATLNGDTFAMRKGGGISLDPFVAERANVVQTGIKVRNGVIHAIDEVLIPPSLAFALARNPAFKNENR